MDYETYRNSYFSDPAPEPRYRFSGSYGVTLYYEEYARAAAFYQKVLGPPAYVEGESTKGWAIGGGWLTLLRGKSGAPRNVEVSFEMGTPEEAVQLQTAFIAAGASGTTPSDQLMYVPIRACPVVDPFGVDIMIFSRLPPAAADQAV